MTIFLIVNSFPRISETFLFNLVVGLEQKGTSVRVLSLSLSHDQKHFLERSEEWSGTLNVMPQSPTSWLVFCFKNLCFVMAAIWRLKNAHNKGCSLANFWLFCIVNKDRPDWVFFSYSGIGVLFLPTIELTPNQKWMVSCRGSAEIVAPVVNPRREGELSRLFHSVTSIHCVSKHMAQTVEKLGASRDKIFVNYPSIDTEIFKRSINFPTIHQGKKFIIVSTGRLNFQKGYPYALLAMRQLIQMGVDFKYHIIGDGDDRVEITYMVQNLGLTDFVILHGRRSNNEVKSLLEQAHVYLLTSIYEGVANAALEALALEIPVVSTRAGGMDEVIQCGNNGILVDCYAVDEIALALAKLAVESDKLQEIGKNGRQSVLNNHSIQKQIHTFYEKFNSV